MLSRPQSNAEKVRVCKRINDELCVRARNVHDVVVFFELGFCDEIVAIGQTEACKGVYKSGLRALGGFLVDCPEVTSWVEVGIDWRNRAPGVICERANDRITPVHESSLVFTWVSDPAKTRKTTNFSFSENV